MTLHHIKIKNGEEITYRKSGEGKKTLVLIHGNMTSSKHWDVLQEALGNQYTVYAMDLRGFGGSSYHNRIDSIQDFSDDVKEFIDALELSDFTLMGWSLGGAVAMKFVADYPGICSKLILLASGSTRGYPVYSAFGKRLKNRDEVLSDIRTVAMESILANREREQLRLIWNSAIYTHNKPDPDRYEAYIDDMLTQRNIGDVYSALNEFNISQSHNGLSEGSGEVRRITIPTLLLYGDRDYVVTEQMTQEIIEDFGDNLKFVRLDNTGHSPLVDSLDSLVAELNKFVKED